MELPSAIVWEMPRICSDSVLSGRDFEVAMATLTCPYRNELVTCSILWYIRMPNWSRRRVIAPCHYC